MPGTAQPFDQRHVALASEGLGEGLAVSRSLFAKGGPELTKPFDVEGRSTVSIQEFKKHVVISDLAEDVTQPFEFASGSGHPFRIQCRMEELEIRTKTTSRDARLMDIFHGRIEGIEAQSIVVVQ